MIKLDLDGQWKFKAVNRYKTLPPGYRNVLRWMKATVPGTVHTDLLANKIIPDPFYRMNENDVQWIESQGWLYTREFFISERFLHEDHIALVAEGLDTYASIRINGTLVANTENMFIAHRFEVKHCLHPGMNRIEIFFDSPVVRSKMLEKRYGKLQVAHEPHRAYVRKAQYSFSWDWGPKLATSGIWRSICLEGGSGGRLANPFVKLISLDKKSAVVEISVDVEKYNGRPATLRVFIGGRDTGIERILPITFPVTKLRVQIPNPDLWWPNGSGGQPMYTALLSLIQDGRELSQTEVPFALRTVRLVQERDAEGRSFLFEVNGVRIYCKGADWIPADSFIPRISDDTYEFLLRSAQDAHMNMIRVWGGGIYEQDLFYTLCDQLGLMVWQDFMFACGEYPQNPPFLRQIRQEATTVLRRLRNHPCIIVWCGNNECEWLFCTENPGKKPDDMKGSKIFRELLPQACKKLDDTRPYWRSTPFGSGFPNSESNGNHHQWLVWSFWRDYKEYEKDKGRFITEFGFQSPADRRTLESVTLPADRYSQSPVMEHHNKQTEGTERLLRFQCAHYRLTDDFDDFIYKGQLVQAEALKTAVEHWRRRKFNTGGSIFWQLNDCWPVSSWSVIDSALRPKAAYYAARKFFNPLLLSFNQVKSGIECWLTNDHLNSFSGRVDLTLKSFDGRILWKKRIKLVIPPNRSVKCHLVPESIFKDLDPHRVYLHGKFSRGNAAMSENRFFFSEPKQWEKRAAKVRMKVMKIQNDEYAVVLQSKIFHKGVRLEMDGENVLFEDNYFDLDPGVEKRVLFESTQRLRSLQKRIRKRSI